MKQISLKLSGIILLFSFIINLSAETDKYRLIYNDNPSTTITICWCQKSGNNPVVYYGKEDFGDDYEKYLLNHKPDRVEDFKELNHNFARIDSLEPNTIYYFVIKDDNSISKRFWFKTIPDDENVRLSIIAGGDSRTFREPRKLANKMVSKLQPHFVVFNGDFTTRGKIEEWKNWLDDWQLTINENGRIIPILIVQGNHETKEELYNIFDTPNEDIYYSLNFGGNLLHAIVLNTEIKMKGAQTKWLEKDLQTEQSKNSIWKFAAFHKPVRPHYSKKREGEDQYKFWVPLFYKYGVKLVVVGDTHMCSRTWSISPDKDGEAGFVRDDEKGTIYIGEGTWGAPVRASDDMKSWTRDCDAIQQFKWIFVSKEEIEIRVVKYQNVEEVGTLSIDDMFSFPENIDIWSPENGAVITITNE